MLASTLQAIAATHIYGTTPEPFLGLTDAVALDGWIERAETLPASLLWARCWNRCPRSDAATWR